MPAFGVVNSPGRRRPNHANAYIASHINLSATVPPPSRMICTIRRKSSAIMPSFWRVPFGRAAFRCASNAFIDGTNVTAPSPVISVYHLVTCVKYVPTVVGVTETQKIVVVPGHRLMIQVPLGGPHRPLFDFHLHQLMTLVKPKSIPKNYGMRFFRLLFKNWCGHRELNPGRSSGR